MLSNKMNRALDAVAENQKDILNLTSFERDHLNLVIDYMDDLAGELDQVKAEMWEEIK